MILRPRHILGSILLISGTTIGGGMLALPVITALGGFLPSLLIYFLTWLFMASTGLLLLEACLWMDTETNIISLAAQTLGIVGKVLAWLVYLFFFYTLTVAYVAGGQALVHNFLGHLLPLWASGLLFILLFAPFIYLGAQAVESVNVLLMVGLALTYLAFVFLGAPHVKTTQLESFNFGLSLMAFPVIFTSFGYQGIVPSITAFLRRDAKAIRFVIIMGTLIPFLVYVIWECLILGIVPTEGAGGLIEALRQGDTALAPLKRLMGSKSINIIGHYFGFFALASSLLGVTLGLRDFLADGLRLKKDAKGRLLLCILIFIPPFIISLINPKIFLTALNVAGGFGCAFLLGLLPILMVWSGRYYHGYRSSYLLPGGKFTLSLLLIFVLFEIALETGHALGLLTY